jgi:hypothetical protein
MRTAARDVAAQLRVQQCGEAEAGAGAGWPIPGGARRPHHRAPRRVTRRGTAAHSPPHHGSSSSRTGARCAGLQASLVLPLVAHACDQSRATPSLTARADSLQVISDLLLPHVLSSSLPHGGPSFNSSLSRSLSLSLCLLAARLEFCRSLTRSSLSAYLVAFRLPTVASQLVRAKHRLLTATRAPSTVIEGHRFASVSAALGSHAMLPATRKANPTALFHRR